MIGLLVSMRSKDERAACALRVEPGRADEQVVEAVGVLIGDADAGLAVLRIGRGSNDGADERCADEVAIRAFAAARAKAIERELRGSSVKRFMSGDSCLGVTASVERP